MVCVFISLTSLAYCILPAEAKKSQLLFFSLEFDLVSISITCIDLSSKIDSSYKWIILMRNPGCQLENIPYTETHYAPADIPDTSGNTKYRNLLTTPTPFQPYVSTQQEPLPSTDVGLITNATSKRRSLDLGRIRPSPLQRDVGGS